MFLAKSWILAPFFPFSPSSSLFSLALDRAWDGLVVSATPQRVALLH
jgi:hypothetical protein